MEDTAEMRNFIEFYKSMPELWNCKNENYKYKSIRNRSYQKLLIEYKKFKSDGAFEELKKKIANMRTCYRRELKKVIKSEKSGAGLNDIYVSTLWYYDAFEFLRDVEAPLPGRSSLSSDEEEPNFLFNAEKRTVPKRSSIANAIINFLMKAADHLESSSKNAKIEDDATIFANGWACMFRQISPNQQLFAKRAFDEILILGRLNQFFFDTVQIDSISSMNSPIISRASTPYHHSTTPVVLSDESVQFLPIPNGAHRVSEPVRNSSSHSYSDFSELLSDSQYQ